MHFTSDISAGSLLAVVSTVCGALITLGGLVQILKRLVQDQAELRDAFEAHAASDTVEFTSIRSSLSDIKVAMAAKETT